MGPQIQDQGMEPQVQATMHLVQDTVRLVVEIMLQVLVMELLALGTMPLVEVVEEVEVGVDCQVKMTFTTTASQPQPQSYQQQP